MDLIERYVQEVGRALPRGKRTDIQRELRSLLQDSLESRTADRKSDGGAEQIELLRELGPPDEMAQSYAPRVRWVVGPRHYKAFTTALRICAVLALITWVQAVVGLAESGDSWLGLQGSAGHIGFHIFQGWLMAVGFLALVFALLERALREPLSDRKEWDPQTLPPVAGPHYASRTATAVRGALALCALALVNLLPGTIGGAFVLIGGESWFVPLLGPGMAAAVLPLNAVLLMDLLLAVALLRRARWSLATRIADVVAKLLWAGVFVKLAAGDSLHAGADSLVGLGWSEEAATFYEAHALSVLRGQLEVILIAAAAIMGVLAVVRIVKHAKGLFGDDRGRTAQFSQ